MNRRILRYGRPILLVINACLLIGGLVLLGCSVWVLDEARGFVMNSFYSTSAIMLTVSGFFMMTLGFIGCLGSHEKARVPLVIFIWGLSGAFLLLVTIQVIAFMFTTGFGADFRPWLYESTKLYFDSTLIQDSWDVLQSRLKCCGISKTGTGEQDDKEETEPFTVWQTNPEFRKANGPTVPESCCVSDLISSFQNYRQFRFQCQGQKEIIHRADCYQKLQHFIRPKVQFVAFSSLVMSILLALAIVSAFLVYRAMQDEARRRTQTVRRSDAKTSLPPERRPVSVSTVSDNISDDVPGEVGPKGPLDQESRTGEPELKKYSGETGRERNFRLQTQTTTEWEEGARDGPHVRHAVRAPAVRATEQEARNAHNTLVRASHKHEFSIRRPGNENRRLQW